VAIRATLAQAYAYLPKPFDLEAAGAIVRRAVARPEVAVEAADVSAWRPGEWVLCGSSEAVLRLRRRIVEVSAMPAPVLFAGEVGSGREAAALVLHDRVAGASRPFRTVRCTTARPGEVAAALHSIAGGDAAFWLFADLEELSPTDVDPAQWRSRPARRRRDRRHGRGVRSALDGPRRPLARMVRGPGAAARPTPRGSAGARLRPARPVEPRGGPGCPRSRRGSARRDRAPELWPGNLRELANVLRAATLRSRSEVVTEEAFAPERQSAPAPPGPT
jgi:transcriptional regulator with GAF, ATPase, and Fis domain